MFNIENLVSLATAYIKKYPPNTGYTINAAQAVYDAYKAGQLPTGTNIGVQLALQYDGAEAGGDLVKIKEKQLPYLASYSLDKGADCMDFVRNLDLLLVGRNVGDWTEGAYTKNKAKQVSWDERRPMDLILFKLSSRNPHATHAALCIGGGLMLHTRSKSKPLMVTADNIYKASKRAGTGVFRVLTDEEYSSLIVGNVGSPAVPQDKPVYTRVLKLKPARMTGTDVYNLEMALEAAGYNCRMTKGEKSTKVGIFGKGCDAALRKWQKKYPQTGELVKGKWVPDGEAGKRVITQLGFIWAGK